MLGHIIVSWIIWCKDSACSSQVGGSLFYYAIFKLLCRISKGSGCFLDCFVVFGVFHSNRLLGRCLDRRLNLWLLELLMLHLLLLVQILLLLHRILLLRILLLLLSHMGLRSWTVRILHFGLLGLITWLIRLSKATCLIISHILSSLERSLLRFRSHTTMWVNLHWIFPLVFFGFFFFFFFFLRRISGVASKFWLFALLESLHDRACFKNTVLSLDLPVRIDWSKKW